CLQYKTYPYSF
nr:immunoglobulin light chain junction region [Macaca mulatta]MOV79632.1 immunoglobulin light chain junction region [Macaca mulatta]MOV80051.1 immunoglobulin light chain junction region [Macaca mulatta]MOV80126.1 immunoglobulin light chain junction region [Macaca mulatta]MOV81097.1 immunoglobulin light chain junction region [Macaca mulatta]